jgi:hypothetical protein
MALTMGQDLVCVCGGGGGRCFRAARKLAYKNICKPLNNICASEIYDDFTLIQILCFWTFAIVLFF